MTIKTRENEEVRFEITEYKGNKYVNMRIYYVGTDGWLPSKKGLTLKIEHLDTIINELTQLKGK